MITDPDAGDADDILKVTLTVTDGTLSVGYHDGASVTLVGTKDYINGELAGAGRRYHEDDESTEADPAPGDLTVLKSSHTEVEYKTIYSKDVYDTGGSFVDTQSYIQTAYQPADPSWPNSGTQYEISEYREVELTGTSPNEVWTFKTGTVQERGLSFDGTQDPLLTGSTQPARFEMDVAVSYDTTGTYWAYEAITGTYRALEVDGLAIYERDDGVRFEHDTVLNTMQALKTEYVSMEPEQAPPDFSMYSPMSIDSYGVGSEVATGVTVEIKGRDTTVDIHEYTYSVWDSMAQASVEYQVDVAFDSGGTYISAIDDRQVADGQPEPNIASDYDFAANGYTKVSGLAYTADGNGSSDTLTIEVRDEYDTLLIQPQNLAISVTTVNDLPVVNAPSLDVTEGSEVFVYKSDLGITDEDDEDGEGCVRRRAWREEDDGGA